MKEKRYFESKQQVEEILKAYRECPSMVKGNKTLWEHLQKYLKDPEGYFS
jgi:hypothetical protein